MFPHRFLSFKPPLLLKTLISNRLSEKLLHVLEEILPVRIILVLDCHVESLPKNSDDVGSVCRRHKIEGYTQILHKLVLSLRGSLIDVDLVCDNDAWNVWGMMSHLLVPTLQVLVSHLARGVKDKDCC